MLEESVPLLELSPITDIYADGVHRIEILGDNMRAIYFRWRMIDGMWRRVAVEFASVRPVTSLIMPLAEWAKGVTVTRPPDYRVSAELH